MSNYYSIHTGAVIDAAVSKVTAITSTAAQIDTVVQAGIYTLPKATATVLGGIKVGANLSITEDGVLSANAGTYTLPTASASVLGGIKVGSNLSIASDGTLSANAGGSILYDVDDINLEITLTL